MNVTCPNCATVFRVDPAKVPEKGVRARCSVCGGLIAVRRPDVAAPVLPPVAEVVAAPPPPPPARKPEPARPEPPRVAYPTPDVPLSALPTEERREEDEVEAPPRPPEAPTAPPPPAAGGGRFSNPFLQQDPSTRARRLARALVSDLVVYHPEKRQRGLADGNLKELFGEEIRKSWEEYVEQVGEELAGTTPYFTEALNEILAEGQSLFG